ncbi:MAG TPA: type VI secretion system tip protein TssI/VgrG [Vicinamibacterales bacterium]|nr:type VI secretion system tip protein TssI/VgrG [Vicinamibacterales bacterium]
MSRVMDRVMDIATPLGEGVLLFHGMRGHEELARISEYHLDLLSDNGDIDVDAILGKNVTIKLGLPDDSTRYFNGFVTRFSQGQVHGRYFTYSATVHPWLWFLTRTADCRIFQEMTVPDIIKKVFADHGTADFKLELTSTYRKWTYCVQYRETDFNFVSRLMEQEGIYYYFRHTDGHNTMVLTDSCSKHVPSAGYEKIPFVAPDKLVRPELEHIGSWQFSREIQPGKYVHKDYDLERPSVDLKTQKVIAYTCAEGSHEVFDYPGAYLQKGDGEQLALVRIDELGTQFETANGTSNARGIAVGALFTLEDCPRADQNCEHLVMAANYDLQFADYEALEGGGTSYQCTFAAMSTKQQFRPRRATPKPFVQGPQTAVVVGPGGDEIYTDQFGRVKVQFHWDRLGKKDENSSCWMRVSHPWAGKGWGAVSTPRIGQEVIVDFLEGDPDQPIITGRIYNAEQMPPYELPANKTQSGIKTRSSTGGSPDNFNEIRFEDKKGEEQLFIHAEKNQDIEVEKDETHWVGHDRTKTIDNDETVLVKHDRKEQVDNDETILIKHDQIKTVQNDLTQTVQNNRSRTVGGHETVRIAKTLTETVVLASSELVGAAKTLSVGGAYQVSVGAAMNETVGGLKATEVVGALMVMVGGNASQKVAGSESIEVAKDQTVTIAKDMTHTVTGKRTEGVKKEYALTAKKVTVTAEDELLLVSGEAKILLKKNGDIEVSGKKINIKGSGDVIIKGSKIAEN